MPKTSPARIWSAAYRIRDVSGLSLFILRISARTRFLPSNVLNPRKLTYHEPSPQGEINAQVASRVGLDGNAASRIKLPYLGGAYNSKQDGSPLHRFRV